MQPVLRQSTTLSYNSYCFKRQDVTGVNHDSINAFAQSLPSMPWGTTVLILSHHFTSCLFSRAGPEYSIIRIFVRWVGIRFSILRFEYHFFFFWTPGTPRKTFLNLSAWLNICNRPFANERCLCWPIACIYFMKNLLLWARLPHIYIWNNELKNKRHNMWTDPLLSQNWLWCMRFLSVNCPEMRGKVLDQRAVALVLQTRCADVKPLWESEREKTRSSWITHAVFKWLI